MSYAMVVKGDAKSQKTAAYLKTLIKDVYDDKNPDKIISIGGDGTFLKAVHLYDKVLDKVDFFVFNTGHLGYFSNFDVNTINDLLTKVNSNTYQCSEFNLLDYKIITGSNTIEGIALNEVTIINPTRTLMLDVFLNNQLLEQFRGTGICISTPAGSTAYNKSLGGAVVDFSLEAFQVTEIASINSRIHHTLSSPLLLSKRHEVEFKAEDTTCIWITADSKSLTIENFQSLAINLSDKKVRLVKNDISFIERLKKNFI